MRDLNKSNGCALPMAGKRSGHFTHTLTHSGGAKHSSLGPTNRVPHGQPCPPVKRVAPSSDFEGFGSFSS